MTTPTTPTPENLLSSLRTGAPAATSVYAALAHTASAIPARDRDQRSALRAAVTRLLAASLRPSDAPIARWLLTQETTALRAAGRGASETLYTLVAAVARFANPDDALLLWHAREATPETREGVDVEQLLRLGVDPVRQRLRSLIAAGGPETEEATQALAWVEQGIHEGAATDLSGYFAWSDERFGLHITGPT